MSSDRERDAEEVTTAEAVDPQETIDVTVLVRAKTAAENAAQIESMSLRPVEERQYPSREEYAAAHGADPADLKAVEDFARAHGLLVKESSASRRNVVLSGPARDVAAAFGVTFRRVATDGGSYRAPASPIRLTPELAPIIEAVLGLDDRPYARSHDA